MLGVEKMIRLYLMVGDALVLIRCRLEVGWFLNKYVIHKLAKNILIRLLMIIYIIHMIRKLNLKNEK